MANGVSRKFSLGGMLDHCELFQIVCLERRNNMRHERSVIVDQRPNVYLSAMTVITRQLLAVPTVDHIAGSQLGRK